MHFIKAACAGLTFTALFCAISTVSISRYLRLDNSFRFVGPEDADDEEFLVGNKSTGS